MHYKFPEGFLWGAATSSHQIEGQNSANDWWEWEASGKAADRSGLACDSYRRYEEDFDIAKGLHHNSHRFSIEWSRVAPNEGEWDESAVRHYVDLVHALRERGLEPIVTLHHFTNPLWVANYGGWENPLVVGHFADFTKRMVEALGDQVRYWVTINEPMVFLFHGYLLGCWPPGKRSVRLCLNAMRHMAQAHKEAYRIIHKARFRDDTAPLVGVARSIQHFVPHREKHLRDRMAVAIRNFWSNRLFFHLIGKSQDFIGLNYYFREIISVKRRPKGLFLLIGEVCRDDERCSHSEYCDLGNEIHPEGIYHVLMSLKSFGVPVIVTECGLGTQDDELRIRHIRGHLKEIARAMGDGVPVVGYQHWSLLDNFEWHHGYRPRFGLVGVDYETQKRTIKKSGHYYAEIARTGGLVL